MCPDFFSEEAPLRFDSLRKRPPPVSDHGEVLHFGWSLTGVSIECVKPSFMTPQFEKTGKKKKKEKEKKTKYLISEI